MHAALGRRSTLLAGAATLAASLIAGSGAARADEARRDVVSIGGSVTEIIYALGQEARIVARDTTSSYPPESEALADVGYMRALSAEGVLSVDPALIISEAGSGPPEAIEVLEAAGVSFVMLDAARDGAGVAHKVRRVGAALDVPDAADTLAASIEADMRETTKTAQIEAGDAPQRVMFVLSSEGGRVVASGEDTAADAMIKLAGGVNAVEGVKGYKPLSDEAIIRAAPDVILTMDRGGDHAMTSRALLSIPAIAVTPAAKTGRIVRMDGLYLLGFGPRTAEAVAELAHALYGDR